MRTRGWWLIAAAICLASQAATAADAPATITRVEQVKRLPARLSSQVPVRFEGVVTYVDLTYRSAFVQDTTGGLRLEVRMDHQLRPGARAEFTALVTGGGPSPSATVEEVVRISDGADQWPEPVRAAEQELATGALQYRLVQVEGRVEPRLGRKGTSPDP